jgi:hypothetical protein
MDVRFCVVGAMFIAAAVDCHTVAAAAATFRLQLRPSLALLEVGVSAVFGMLRGAALSHHSAPAHPAPQRERDGVGELVRRPQLRGVS